ncbi:hypothetical protein B0H13DRAFT_1884674 [Mycena leptocephala]|nr:hypothetical protein B0H13DRAFT_1884674 [Mycena leptocephala]
MARPKKTPPKPPKDSGTYRPRQTQAQRQASHRLASARYYARYEDSEGAGALQLTNNACRNPEVREKNRVNMRARRAVAKARRRQWDPPKPNKAIQDMPRSESAQESDPFDPALVSSELLDGSMHFQDPRGATTSSDEDSQFRLAEQRRRVVTESSEVPLAGGSAPTSGERLAVAVLANMGAVGRIGGSQDSVLQMAMLLSSHERDASDNIPLEAPTAQPASTPGPRVQAALTALAALNAAPLTAPTETEARHWVRKTFGFWGHFLEYRQQQAIEAWREKVPLT